MREREDHVGHLGAGTCSPEHGSGAWSGKWFVGDAGEFLEEAVLEHEVGDGAAGACLCWWYQKLPLALAAGSSLVASQIWVWWPCEVVGCARSAHAGRYPTGSTALLDVSDPGGRLRPRAWR